MTLLQVRLRTLATSLVITTLAVLTVACGSSNNFSDVSGQQQNVGFRSFVGQYLGANNMPGNQVADLDFTVTSNGLASGNLATRAVVTQTVNPGSFPVFGEANLSSGAFSLTGNIPGLGDFEIVGTLPTGNNQANYQFLVNGQTFQGVVQPAALGAPNAPGTGPGDDGKAIQGGTVSSFVFTPDGNYNGENPPVDTDSAISGGVGTGVDGKKSATIALSETIVDGATVTLRLLTVTIVAPQGEELEVGRVYPLASGSADGVVVTLSESVGANVVEGWSLVQGTTGQATITSLTDTNITVQFQFTNVGPNSEITNNPAEGTFNTSGTITGNFVSLP